MKNSQKGFVVPLLIGIITLLVIGGGVYMYENKKVEVPVIIDNTTQQSIQQTNAQTLPIIKQQNLTNKNLDNQQFTITWPTNGATLIAGKTYTITWTGIDSHVNNYEIYLWKESQQVLDGHQGTGYVSTIASSVNPVSASKNSFLWTVPSTLKAGDDYHIDFGNVSYPGNNRSARFTITNDDNSSTNWQTYSNSQYGFSIQYPSNAQINDVDISGGRNISFTTSQGILMVEVVTQAWHNGVLSSPPNCDDTAGGQDQTNTTINGVNFITFSMSKEMSGMNSHVSATEYCTISGGTAHKVITRVNYEAGTSNGVGLDNNPVLNQMLSSFKLLSANSSTQTFTPNFTSALQPTIIYKTSGDYFTLVPVTLNDQKTQVTSYPDIRDVYYSGYANTQLAYPTKLDNGYLLDNRGVGANSVFLKYTYDQYSKLSKTPSSAELFSSILITSPFLEMYDCGARNFGHDTEQQTISEVNALIIDSNQLSKCKRVI